MKDDWEEDYEGETTFDYLCRCAGFCCGETDKAATFLRDVLRLMADRQEAALTCNGRCYDDVSSELYRLLNVATHPGMAHLVLYFLDKMGLTDHGCGCMGSWPSPKGYKVLAKLEAEYPAAKDEGEIAT